MKLFYRELVGILLPLFGLSASATVRYVDVNGTNATPPFTNWSSAAVTIQDAVVAADPGDQIFVTNGVYQTGGRVVYGAMTNRVAVTKAVTVQSVNGPAATVIRGYQVALTTNGDSAVRCVYLTNGAVLAGFTLTNGATRFSGDPTTEGRGGGVWCETNTAVVVSNCVLTGNSAAYYGGGAQSGLLTNCTLIGNSAPYGGGSAYGVLNNCTVQGNVAFQGGGGVFAGRLNGCALTGNEALFSVSGGYGGGAHYSNLTNCIVSGNRAANYGGGADSGLFHNCVVNSNSAYYGGGISVGTLYNCTVVGNLATNSGGGVWYGMAANCIIYYNSAASNENSSGGSILSYCCTTPMPPPGIGNITNEPAFVDLAGGNLRLKVVSPCINAGDNSYVTVSADLDGESRIIGGTVDMGAYEFRAPVHFVALNSTNPIPPYSTWATAATNIQDGVDIVAPGEEVVVTNGIYATGGRAVGTNLLVNRVAVDKPIMVRSVNGPQSTRITGQQVPGSTNGNGAIRCVSLASGATLSGFTLSGGATQLSGDESKERSGGGVWMSPTAVVTNCVIIGNSACSGGGASGGTLINCTLANNMAFGPGFSLDGGMSCGGGAYGSTLDHCVLTDNSAEAGGGVARSGLINCILTGNFAGGSMGGGGGWAAGFRNCTVTGNSAQYGGGGASECNVYNSIVYYNTAPEYPDRVSCWTENSCTTPLGNFASVSPNITNAPLFVNIAGGNLRLQSSSPCINAGNNAHAVGLTDFGGNPRIVGGTVDIGAYEFATPASVISYAWLQQYGLPADGSADFADPDGEGMNNWQEWRADTVPTNALSALRMLSPTGAVSGVTVRWQSVSTRSYWLERATALTMQPAFSTIATNLPGQAGTKTYTDTSAIGSGPFFYRVGVQP